MSFSFLLCRGGKPNPRPVIRTWPDPSGVGLGLELVTRGLGRRSTRGSPVGPAPNQHPLETHATKPCCFPPLTKSHCFLHGIAAFFSLNSITSFIIEPLLQPNQTIAPTHSRRQAKDSAIVMHHEPIPPNRSKIQRNQALGRQIRRKRHRNRGEVHWIDFVW